MKKIKKKTIKKRHLYIGILVLIMMNVFNIGHTDKVQAAPTIPYPTRTIPVQGISLTPNNRKMDIGGTITLLLTINPSNATDKSVTWSSSNQKVATVNSSGKVTAVGYGTATIMVTSSNGKRAISNITVEKENTTEATTQQVTEIITERTTENKTAEKTTEVSTTEKETVNNTTEKPVEISRPVSDNNHTQTADKNISVKKGMILSSSTMIYKVTNISTKTVSCLKPKSYKNTKVTIPTTIHYSGKVYKVTRIENNAFKNCKNLKSVTIGKNITTIGKKAFYGCKKLKNIDIRSKKLKKVGSKAFKKIAKKPVVRVPRSKLKKYKKLLKGKI